MKEYSAAEMEEMGPLVVSAANPRYFAVAKGKNDGKDDGKDTGKGTGDKAVYLTGSHIWNNFQDGMGPGGGCAAQAEQLGFRAYLEFLQERGHNFIRLWRWEQFKSQAAGGAFHLCMEPQPWPRTGPGTAVDGKPKFDLSKFNPAYFARLREFVIAAGEVGIYVGVMLFDGWALHLSPPPDSVEGHPFFAANNANGISITSIVDYQVLPLAPGVLELQEAYIRKVVDTVQDLPNVLYEVANESSGGGTVDQQFAEMMGMREPPNWGDSTQWQYWVINVVKRYEQEQGYTAHPIGMTMQFPVANQRGVNDPLFASPADWISPGYDDEIFAHGGHPMAPGSPPSHWFANPPAADGRKVIITDTDHYAPGQGDALWAWKSFLRGHHPILMDFGLIDGLEPVDPPSPGAPPFAAFEAARYAMGDTLRYAERMELLAMTPRGDLASTTYALANPGREYLVLQPTAAAAPFTVILAPGRYECEWFDVNSRRSQAAQPVTAAKDERRDFRTPFGEGGPAVLYLKAGE